VAVHNASMLCESDVVSLLSDICDVVVAKRKPGSEQHHGKEGVTGDCNQFARRHVSTTTDSPLADQSAD
jgi:hypothetical protein